MALLTPLTDEDAQRLATAYGLGRCETVTPLEAGSVNSNFILKTSRGSYFARIYEEQGESGVAFEWAVLHHLRAAKFPVPMRVVGPRRVEPAVEEEPGHHEVGPGEIRVADRPTALFELVGGTETCLANVNEARARAVGQALGRLHTIGADFGWRRGGRFTLEEVLRRLDRAQTDSGDDAALRDPIARIRTTTEQLICIFPQDLPTTLIHGDLFRDNVRWEGDEILAILDWESASTGTAPFDIAVAVLAWCYRDDLDWPLARAMLAGYVAERPLTAHEWFAIHPAARAACVRFATTRITDFYLRNNPARDFRRFLARLDTIEAHTPQTLATELGAPR